MMAKSKIKKEAPVSFVYGTILLLYVVIAVYTPQGGAFDSNGPKFLGLAGLNLLVAMYFFTRKGVGQNPSVGLNFFRSNAAVLYALLIFVSLLSFVKAVNLNESILQFSKAGTVFITCYFVAFIVASDRRLLETLATGMVIFLILDALSVYYYIGKFIKGELADIEQIRTVYSNKNVLAASIFIKLPFALWLYTFHTGWKQKLGLAGWGSSILALLFLSSRAFYLGILVLSVAYIASLWILYRKKSEAIYRNKIGLYGTILIGSFLLFSLVQRNFYTTPSLYNAGIVERLKEIKPTEYSTGERLAGWKRSLHVIQKEPLLGCGLGNWKIATLQEENQTKTDFTYQFRAHNDLLETTAETGIFGGLAFLSIFILLLCPYLRALFSKEETTSLSLLFLPAFGMGAYLVDACFNFPHDRPEILVLFALFVGTGIALTQKDQRNRDSAGNNPSLSARQTQLLSYSWKGVLLTLMLFALYILALNYQSLRTQKVVSDEISSGKLTLGSDKIAQEFPRIPDINIFGETIAVQKARYLISEKKIPQAIALLRRENHSPYDSRREYFLASAYLSMGKLDSALYWNRQVLQIKPYLLENMAMMCNIFDKTGKIQEGIPLLEKYLDRDKQNPKAWLLMVQCLDKSGELKKALAYSDSACKHFPADASILQRRDYQNTRVQVAPHNDLYDQALNQYNGKEYEKALGLFTDLINKGISLPRLFEYRAFCYYFTQQYHESIQDIDHLFSLGLRQPNLLNLRGTNLQALGSQSEACSFFKEAMKAGDQEGAANWNRFCK